MNEDTKIQKLKKQKDKIAKIVFKRLKACGFSIELLKERFEITEEDISEYNRRYGYRFGYIR